MLEKGAEIKGYRIERLLGRGGMGEVYEATQLGLGRRVAFKVVHTGLGDDSSFRERFRREGRLQATLEHPNVVTVYEAGEIDEGLFLAMRLVDGVTLKQLIVDGELDADRALGILAPVAEALDAAHASGLIHRDVKPQNILVGDDDQAFLADFGLTRGQDQSGFTRSGNVVGTIDYISPEQVRGEPATAASDVYAFGGVLFECLTGSVPYARPSDPAVLYAHVNDDPPSVRAVRDDLSAGLDQVVARGMAKEPDERPSSAGDLVAAAAAEIGSGPAASSRPPRRGSLAHGVRAVTGDTAEVAPDDPTHSRKTTLERTRAGWRVSPATLMGVAGVTALGVLAFLGGRTLSEGDAPKLTTSASSQAVSLRAPGDWDATPEFEQPAIPGLRLGDAVGVAPAQRDASGVSAGMTAARGPRLLPATLVDRVVGDLPRPAAVTLGKLQALRYRSVELRGFDRDLTLYASPSTAGVAILACYSPGEKPDFVATCESIAQSLELSAARPYPLATSPQTERALRRAVSGLAHDRSAARRALASAGTDGGQASASKHLARAYAVARREFGRLALSPAIAGQVDAVRAALAASEDAARKMGDSAKSGDAAGFEAAKQTLSAGEARVDIALAALGREPEVSSSG